MERRGAIAIVFGIALLAAACSGDDSGDSDADRLPADASSVSTPGSPLGRDAEEGEIVVRRGDRLGPFDRRLLGTNVPAWLGPQNLGDPQWVKRTIALGTTVLRFPGGSWSSAYDWLGCENADEANCYWPWAARPSDAATFLRKTHTQGMWTVSFNGTAQEAAALVAFFNGSVGDDTPIGTDRNGRDWKTVGTWAQLRAEHGNPAPVRIDYWEVGNEVYGAKPPAKGDCADFGWEDTWTCDGDDYVNGDSDHDGFLAFREAMLAVDPEIEVGAVGVDDQDSWGNWGNKVIEGAGDKLDFYVVHHYGFGEEPSADEVLSEPESSWPGIMENVGDALDDEPATEDVPVAVTEFNLVSFVQLDNQRVMTTAANALYLGETLGQLAVNGVDRANQWNLGNGRAQNGSDYGLMDSDTGERSPSYYTLALWSRFEGTDLTAVDTDVPLSVYAGRREDGGVDLFVINTTIDAVPATVLGDPSIGSSAVTADVVEAAALDSTSVTFNGATDPSDDLSEPAIDLGKAEGPIEHTYPPVSMTVLHVVPAP